jgi:hypothetical protein
MAGRRAMNEMFSLGDQGSRAPFRLDQGSGAGGAKAIPAEDDSEGDMSSKLECVICMCNMKKPAVTKCGHLFCNLCIRDCTFARPANPSV